MKKMLIIAIFVALFSIAVPVKAETDNCLPADMGEICGNPVYPIYNNHVYLPLVSN